MDLWEVVVKYRTCILLLFVCFAVCSISSTPLFPLETEQARDLDKRVTDFFESHRYQWRDMNVPPVDGKVLYDLVIRNDYKRALEIGTSTGHSTIWIAWALSKTGGKLITVEINKRRYEEALANFKEAGLSDYIDARLADAHALVPQLKGPFNFVFCDADKNWYKNYLTAVLPSLEVGGCFTAHNVLGRRGSARDFVDYLVSLAHLETTIDRSSGSGISISYKRSEK